MLNMREKLLVENEGERARMSSGTFGLAQPGMGCCELERGIQSQRVSEKEGNGSVLSSVWSYANRDL